ncbi:glutamate--tRNA ligase [Buchnera aphidicola (Muscaphis stroyani)]|uniref:Glutamate--tRNA ligase n=1 Tax=Buchnera aphidicola (Muscaphis stroyani) TaxID=1241869 RepID=A0A4D6Y4Z6_9GAMM|nr:glutamate--tRNA ligase [Buchnera aphidicola]QCI24179.1 glutamate--tRNA ligase [Buchnera aphidicola (Muscaphis stroyani)]
MTVITRFAPSPTGNLHIGSIRTALYSWLFARHYNGKFLLRIEDSDVERSTLESVQSILSGLKWLGLNWDKGPYFQSERLDRYKNVIRLMLNEGKAYKCYCSFEKIKKEREFQISKNKKPRYSGTCRNLKNEIRFNQDYVVRFKNPLSGKVIFSDQIRGRISFDNSELDDLIIQRSNGMPTYNFCVVVDDLDMNVTHVIRGEDHINNTPRQINILKSLEANIPIYAHVSMILDETGKKISKRKDSMNIIEYRENGFLPEALLNYILRLGWSYGDKEIFDLVEMKKLFNLKFISKSPSIINEKKLLWLNRHYINNLPFHYVSECLKFYFKKRNIDIKNGPNVECIIELFKNRCYTFQQIVDSSHYFYKDFSYFDKIAAHKYLVCHNFLVLKELYKKIFFLYLWETKGLSKVIDKISIKFKMKKKEISMILRVSVTGNVHSPGISTVMYLIGREKTLIRINKAINYIKNVNF